MAKQINVKPEKVALALATRRKKPRGTHEHLRKYAFKRGYDVRRNPGGKPKIYMRFSAMLMERMMEKCPLKVRKELGLKQSATIYDALIVAQLHNAMAGDNAAFMAVHDLVEGKLPNRNINLSASMERLLNDAGFRQFIESQLPMYLGQKGEDDGTGLGATSGALGGEIQTEPND